MFLKMISKKRKRIVGMISWNRKNHGSKEGAPVSDDKILASALFNKIRGKSTALALSAPLHQHASAQLVQVHASVMHVCHLSVSISYPFAIGAWVGTSMTGPSVTVSVYPRGQDQWAVS